MKDTEKNTDVYHITVAGVNPHDVASEMQQEGSPFHDPIGGASVFQHIIVGNQIVGGIVDVWAPEHLTPTQEAYLANSPHIIDVRHVWPK
jgi:hypothetical protein